MHIRAGEAAEPVFLLSLSSFLDANSILSMSPLLFQLFFSIVSSDNFRLGCTLQTLSRMTESE
jgi:hypothetical protein